MIFFNTGKEKLYGLLCAVVDAHHDGNQARARKRRRALKKFWDGMLTDEAVATRTELSKWFLQAQLELVQLGAPPTNQKQEVGQNGAPEVKEA